MEIRVLDNSDQPRLESFLLQHRDSSMFLRSNVWRVGLDYRNEPFHALYAGVIQESQIVGVVAHAWNGMVLLQCPEDHDELVRSCVLWSGRKVMGFSGPVDQVRRARIALELEHASTRLDEEELLYALDLTELQIPAALANGEILCRPPLPEDRDTLRRWSAAYDIETLGGTDSEEARTRSADAVDRQIADGNAWVAIRNGELVSLSAFNAALPDIVQLGGIYTPPEFRGNGYAKSSVAGSLIAARQRGVSRAILFTSNPSAAKSYVAVGFRHIGDYGLVLLK